MNEPIELTARIAAAARRTPGIELVYLFGSRAGGRARPDSDVDLAVRYAANLDDAARERCRRSLLRALTMELGGLGERADLVDLERCGVTIAFRAIHDGHCVLAADPLSRARVEARIARAYDDERPRRMLFRRAALRAGRRMGERALGRS